MELSKSFCATYSMDSSVMLKGIKIGVSSYDSNIAHEKIIFDRMFYLQN